MDGRGKPISYEIGNAINVWLRLCRAVVVECVIPEDRLRAALDTIHRTARGLQSVCWVGLIRRFADAESPTEWARRRGLQVAPNGKVNLAMGQARGQP
jgi:hypothetical protein